ncbi:MAG: DUF2256 domain-containing protein [Planctomycetaceae bacterium]|nr:DUF2256 domain-containing protein [Planctomycetaceae bacterium]
MSPSRSARQRRPVDRSPGKARPRRENAVPPKTCPVCQRPFEWRKKWEHCWDDVVYCSQRCRRGGVAPPESR